MEVPERQKKKKKIQQCPEDPAVSDNTVNTML